MTDSRPGWDEVWMTTAKAISRRSRCAAAQVGAVIVTRDNRVASCSHNGPAPRIMVSGSCESWCPVMQGLAPRGSPLCLSSHAEANGLLRSDWASIQKGTIYSSAATCIACARLIAGAGLATLVHCVSGEDDERRNPDAVEKYLREAGVAVRRYRGWPLSPEGG